MKKGSARVEIDEELHARLRKFCKLTGATMRAVLERLIVAELDRKVPKC